jgi:hypothetical protein
MWATLALSDSPSKSINEVASVGIAGNLGLHRAGRNLGGRPFPRRQADLGSKKLAEQFECKGQVWPIVFAFCNSRITRPAISLLGRLDILP